MPKLERWIVASKMVPVLDRETLKEVIELGGSIGGGWSQVHQHINVNADNKEKIEKLLFSRGYDVSDVCDKMVTHPEFAPRHFDRE
jgi:hypothetical protein